MLNKKSHSCTTSLYWNSAATEEAILCRQSRGSQPFCDCSCSSLSTLCCRPVGLQQIENLWESKRYPCIKLLVGDLASQTFLLILENPQFASRHLQHVCDYRQGLDFLFSEQILEFDHCDTERKG